MFSKLPTSHVPLPITGADMETMVARLRASSLNVTSAMKLYDRLHGLSVPSFSGKRMRLPCLTFKLGPVSAARSVSGRAFRAKTDGLGIVEITTTVDLSRLDSLILVHPWVDFLLNRQPVGSVAEMIAEEPSNEHPFSISELASPGPSNITSVVPQTRAARLVARLGQPFGSRPRDVVSLLSPSPVSLTDKRMQALQLLARLRQPFGALLFTPTRQNVAEYRRVAAESEITVRVQDDTPLSVLIASAQMLDVL